MKEFASIKEVLDFAISNEETAIDFYMNLAERIQDPAMRKAFLNFAKEEKGHKARLMSIKEKGLFLKEGDWVSDIRITDYMIRTEPSEDMTYADALRLAMKREKAAYKLYMKLLENAPNEEMAKIFEHLALEEANHKLRFEVEYDEVVLREL